MKPKVIAKKILSQRKTHAGADLSWFEKNKGAKVRVTTQHERERSSWVTGEGILGIDKSYVTVDKNKTCSLEIKTIVDVMTPIRDKAFVLTKNKMHFTFELI